MSETSFDVEELRGSIRDVLDIEASRERVHAHIDGDAPHDVQLAATVTELGWAALGLAEEDGGLGLGLPGLAMLHEELGRGPAPLPMLPTLLAITAIAGGGNANATAAWLPALIAGEAFAGVSLRQATIAIENGRASGEAQFVIGAPSAGPLVILTSDDRAIVVSAGGEGVEVEPVAPVDRTRSMSHVRLAGAVFEEIVIDTETLAQHAAIAIAADSVGGAASILERTIEFLKTREQFGKPIGSFQALKHRVANHKLTLESASSLLAEAILESGVKGRGQALAQLAKAYAADSYATIADDAVQLHGGIGFTWEQDCHIFLKRARLNQQLLGDSDQMFDQAAALLTEIQ